MTWQKSPPCCPGCAGYSSDQRTNSLTFYSGYILYICVYNCHFVFLHETEKPKASPIGNSSPMSARLDDRTELKCRATGWPKPNITWIRNGRNVLDINQDNEYDVYVPPGADFSELDIIVTRWEHEGKYICMARNALGEDNATIEVLVEGNLFCCAIC